MGSDAVPQALPEAGADQLAKRAAAHLHYLCRELPGRRTGSPGNRQASAFFGETIARFGFRTEAAPFDCIDWECDGSELRVGGASIPAPVSPYSPGCQARGPLQVIRTVEELAAASLAGSVLLLHGPIAAEPLMPKGFPFYNPESHQRIIGLLEAGRPAAIISATGRHPELAGGSYPYPLIEDGDFAIPSVYLTDVVGEALATQAGAEVELSIKARRIPSVAHNLIARKGEAGRPRIVLFAHIDAKDGTPGALDNAAGVVTLLLFGELCADYSRSIGLEIVALNGEDYYCAPGEQRYLRDNAGRFDEIMLGINIDGVGYREGRAAYSLYDCPPSISSLIRTSFAPFDDLVEGVPWYQGDHGLFLMNQRPALALTSEQLMAPGNDITHTANDTPELVDCVKLARIAVALHNLVAG